MRNLLVWLSLLLAGCGKCCTSTPSPSSSSTESTGPACCDVEPSRAAILAGKKDAKLIVSDDDTESAPTDK